jgi:hypothetical protein
MLHPRRVEPSMPADRKRLVATGAALLFVVAPALMAAE